MTDELTDRESAEIADELAHHYLGTPEADMLSELYDVRARAASQLAELAGPDVAATTAAAFIAAVVRRRREIECAAFGRGLN
jgi:hypothetical protein